MTVETRSISIHTNGNGDVQDITSAVQDQISDCMIENGIATVFTGSSTSGITTLEFETGCVKDIQRLFDEILPPDREYEHNKRWGDGNGHSHARAALLKPSLTIPFIENKLTLGTWQQIVFVDFDNRDRQRKIIIQILGD